jgi:hypothetical protein
MILEPNGRMEVIMVGIIIGAVIVAYTGIIIYKKTKDLKAGKSCCGGCDSCPSKGKCS